MDRGEGIGAEGGSAFIRRDEPLRPIGLSALPHRMWHLRDHGERVVDRRLAVPTGDCTSKADPAALLVVRWEGPAGRGPPLPARGFSRDPAALLVVRWEGPRGGVLPFPRAASAAIRSSSPSR